MNILEKINLYPILLYIINKYVPIQNIALGTLY